MLKQDYYSSPEFYSKNQEFSRVFSGSSFAYNVSSPSGGNTTNERFTCSGNIFAKEQTAVWSAVNSELKNRQKIAKVWFLLHLTCCLFLSRNHSVLPFLSNNFILDKFWTPFLFK